MADIFDDEIEHAFTIDEYMEGLEAEELEADLLLGGDEGKECTYSNGYMKRQAVFSCLTCVPNGNAGVCTACNLSCHDGHKVVELWTKRNFKCDCGNTKFGEFNCKLCPIKDNENKENSYNQNFKGLYCTCHHPFSDAEAVEQAEMIQCCICEDWHHEDHLGLDSINQIPRDEKGEPLYDEFICQECSPVCSFLDLYPSSIWVTLKQKNVTVASPKEIELEYGIQSAEKGNGISTGITTNSSSTCYESKKEIDLKCIIGVDVNRESIMLEKKRPMFLSRNWRDLLCQCNICSEFYNKNGIGYLIEKEDSIQEYVKTAKEKREERSQKQEEEAEMKFLDTMNHVQKIEFLSGISDMKNEFRSFLESFDASKPVTPDDIEGVFENLRKKRQRLQ